MEGGGFWAVETRKECTGAGQGGREGSERFKRKLRVPLPRLSSLHVVGAVICLIQPPTCNDDGPIGRWCGGSHFTLYRPTPPPLQASQIITARCQGLVIGQGVASSHCTSPHFLQCRSDHRSRSRAPRQGARYWRRCGGSCCHHCCQGPGCSGQVRGGGVVAVTPSPTLSLRTYLGG